MFLFKICQLRDELSDLSEITSTERLTTIFLDALPAKEYSAIKIQAVRPVFMGTIFRKKILTLPKFFPTRFSFTFYELKCSQKIFQDFKWPQMRPLRKILARDFEKAAVMKILGRRDRSIAPLISTGNRKHSKHKKKRTQHGRRWLGCGDSCSCYCCDSCTESESGGWFWG